MSKEEALNVWNFFHEILETKIMQQKLKMYRLVLKQKVAQVMTFSRDFSVSSFLREVSLIFL